MFEIYLQNFDFTTVYTVYITFLLSVSLSVLWIVRVELPFIQSCLRKLSFNLQPTDFIYKELSGGNTRFTLKLLRRVRMKVSKEDDLQPFSPISYHS